MQACARHLAHCEETSDPSASLFVHHDATTKIVCCRHHWDRLLRHIDSNLSQHIVYPRKALV